MLLNELVCWDPPALPFTVFFELYKNISWYALRYRNAKSNTLPDIHTRHLLEQG